MTSKTTSYILGIDLGTTSIKVVLLNPTNHAVIESSSQATDANISCNSATAGNDEQDVDIICKVLQFCLLKLDQEKLSKASQIGVSGQMHGIVLWKGKPWRRNQEGIIEVVPDAHSCLYTWQDSRCTGDFLASLPKPKSHLRLATGHGCATLFWLQRHRPEYVKRFDRAGTVMDFVVAALCDLDAPVMSVQNAASWGYFDTIQNAWNTERYVLHV